MTRFFALADDLTGALEIGARFAGSTVTTRLAWECGATAMVIDTETRHLAEDEAAVIVRQLACEARELGARFIYKKTDSTLRGNIGAELFALASVFPEKRVVYVPAYPRMGRTVVNGCLFVHGVPVHLTEFARDAMNPVQDSRVPAPENVDVWDAETEEDVVQAAEKLMKMAEPVLAAGTAALAEALSRKLGAPAQLGAFSKLPRCLVVNGSLHPLSMLQAAGGSPARGWTVWGQGGPGIGRKVRDAIQDFDGLFIFGGDTAFEVLAALECEVVRPLGEIVPGVPLSRIEFEGRQLILLTKAGGFGPVDIVPAVQRLL